MRIFHIGLCAKGRPLNGLQKALLNLGVYTELDTAVYVEKGKQHFNAKCIEIAKDFKPDLVFIQVQTPNIIEVKTLKIFKALGAKTVNWNGDVRDNIPAWMLELAPYCITSLSNVDDVNTAKQMGFNAAYLQIGFDPEIYNQHIAKVTCPDIVFMGNSNPQFPLYKYRLDIVNALKAKYGARFKVYGSGWGANSGDTNADMQQQASIYASCKIAINCSNYNRKRYSSDRLYRVMGAGAFCLTHNYPQIETDWEVGEELVAFNSIPQL